MNEPFINANMIISVAGFAVGLIGLIQSLCARQLVLRTRRFFIAIFSIVIGYTICIFLREAARGYEGVGPAWLSRITLFGQAFLSSLLPVLILLFLLYQSGVEKRFKNRFFLASALLWIIYAFLLIFTQFSGIIYAVDDQNRYTRGPLFFLLVIPPTIIMAMILMALWNRRKWLTPREKIAFSVYSVVPMIATILQIFSSGLQIIVIGTVLATIVMYSFIIMDQTEQYHKQQNENAQMKIDILLAQIQPHFLFNSLTTIRYLCRNDPALAEEAVAKFTEYLRHNMDSLQTDMPIPFEKELNHVKEYLALQQIRFGDELKVEYDLEYTDFKIPTLTLQPLVENAVSYGIRKNESGTGTVRIRTRKESDHVEVIVEDDGPGFDARKIPEEKERSHTGLKNVRERLKRVSDGQLQIDSEPGKGTKVTMILGADAFRKDETC